MEERHENLTSFYRFLEEPDMEESILLLNDFINLAPKHGAKLMLVLQTFIKQQNELVDNVVDEVISNVDEIKAKEIKAYLGEQHGKE